MKKILNKGFMKYSLLLAIAGLCLVLFVFYGPVYGRSEPHGMNSPAKGHETTSNPQVEVMDFYEITPPSPEPPDTGTVEEGESNEHEEVSAPASSGGFSGGGGGSSGGSSPRVQCCQPQTHKICDYTAEQCVEVPISIKGEECSGDSECICNPRTPGYWKNHMDDANLTCVHNNYDIFDDVTTQEEMYEVLDYGGSDKLKKLKKFLMATILNICNSYFDLDDAYGGETIGYWVNESIEAVINNETDTFEYYKDALQNIVEGGVECNPETHMECDFSEMVCKVVLGEGEDECTSDLDCVQEECEPPYLEIGKYATPSEIICEESRITLTVTGGGEACELYYPIDVVLVFDKSGSMDDDGWDETINDWQPIGDAKIAAKTFVDLLGGNDRAGLVSFATRVNLDEPLTFDHQSVKDDIDSMSAGGWTNMSEAVGFANHELMDNGRTNATWIEILLSDGNNNCGTKNPPEDCHQRVFARAEEAAENGIIIYTIALGENANQTLMEQIANMTGGGYYYAPNSEDLEEIYEEIAEEVTTFAGTDVVVYDYLPPYVELNESSLPGECEYNESERGITCELGTVSINETVVIEFDIYLYQLGYNLTNVYPDSGVSYTDYNGTNQFVPFPETYVTVHGFEGANEICDDGYDNDCDGYVDWEDPDCRHNVCNYTILACENVPDYNGTGDECQTFEDCPQHTECDYVQEACLIVEGQGMDECRTYDDCFHTECSDGYCIVVEGSGEDQCSNDAECRHFECNYADMICEEVASPGEDECETFVPDCGECDEDSDCDHLDRNYCENDSIMHVEGICVEGFCAEGKAQKIDECYYHNLYCSDDELREEVGFCNPDGVFCDSYDNLVRDCYYRVEYCEGDARVYDEGFCDEMKIMCDNRTGVIEDCSDNNYEACENTYYKLYHTETCQEDSGSTQCVPSSSLVDCRDGLWCNGDEYCSEEGGVHCESGTPVDCSAYDIPSVGECTHSPDDNPYTWDYYVGFTSECVEDGNNTGHCTRGVENLTHTCSVDNCSAECDSEHGCPDSECSETYDDYCSGRKLVEYDNDRVMDSTTVTDSCENSCTDTCECTECGVDCSPPGTSTYCVKGVCGAECEKDSDCSCPEDGCVGTDWYDYPDYGVCRDDCMCDVGEELCSGPCKPSITYNDPRCTHLVCDYEAKACVIAEGDGEDECETWDDCAYCGNGVLDEGEECEISGDYAGWGPWGHQYTCSDDNTYYECVDCEYHHINECSYYCSADFECDGLPPMTYLETCDYGFDYLQDYCDVNCHLADDNCESDYNGCTADPECDEFEPSTGYCNYMCEYKPSHMVCNYESLTCESVPTPGEDECATFEDCPQHRVCDYEQQACVIAEGDGEDECETWDDCLYCGDGELTPPEQCELPGTDDNSYCAQTTRECSGRKLGVRDAYGYCDEGCGCVEDQFVYSCVKGECGAECGKDEDCEAYCEGDTYYHSGACDTQTDCSCSYLTEDCNSHDGCYAYGNGCEERNYYCSTGGCDYIYSNRNTDYYDRPVRYCSGDKIREHELFHDFYCDSGCEDHTSWTNDELVEDCNSYDGWYETNETRWVEVDECNEKEERKEEYRDYYCYENGDVECEYEITDYRWVETGNTRYKPDGTSCDDGLWCTEGDVCIEGSCTGEAKDCSDGVGCTVDTCDEASDVCVHTPDDSFCDDGLYCNGNEYCDPELDCQAGTPVNCDHLNSECGEGFCNEESDRCELDPYPLSTPCEADGNVCTVDHCDGKGKCVYKEDLNCQDSNECTYDYCDPETGCYWENKAYGTWCGEWRDCPDDECADPYKYFYPVDGHDYCDGKGKCLVYSCESIGYECDVDCGAECDSEHGCPDSECSETYDDYCSGRKLVEYDNDRVMDSTTVTDSCENSCTDTCECTECGVDCSPPGTSTYCVKGVCGAECEKDSDCSCPEDGCVGTDWYDYPDYSQCSDNCECGGCEPAISICDPRCMGDCRVKVYVKHLMSPKWPDLNDPNDWPYTVTDDIAIVVEDVSGGACNGLAIPVRYWKCSCPNKDPEQSAIEYYVSPPKYDRLCTANAAGENNPTHSLECSPCKVKTFLAKFSNGKRKVVFWTGVGGCEGTFQIDVRNYYNCYEMGGGISTPPALACAGHCEDEYLS